MKNLTLDDYRQVRRILRSCGELSSYTTISLDRAIFDEFVVSTSCVGGTCIKTLMEHGYYVSVSADHKIRGFINVNIWV